MLCGWFAPHNPHDTGVVVNAMACALRAHARQRWRITEAPGGLAVATIVHDGDADQDRCDPAVSSDRRFWLWLAGEAYAGGSLCDVSSVAFSRTHEFRTTLLDALMVRGVDAIASLDGRYQLALFDAVERRVVVASDRFGGVPTFWARSAQGTAFAGGVRGVLMAPSMPVEPDADAIREAVTFGGFRLGPRTNVRGVERLRGGSLLVIDDRVVTRDYWRWPAAPPAAVGARVDLVAEAHRLWQRAVAIRMSDAQRPGQTLSGGVDSRAILAEASPLAQSWTAITYGVDGCDDARYAQRAASAAKATWIFDPLYQTAPPDWLERRTALVQETDGLVQLSDLLHAESLRLQRSLIDVHMSGYIGDVVCGTTYDRVVDAPSLLAKLPYSGVSLAWTWSHALEWGAGAIAAVAPGLPKYAIYEHKFPQAIHPIFQIYAPYVRVRGPFTDYALFDFFARLPDATREWLYKAWMAERYPAFFSAIPDQSTGLPVGASRAQIAVERARRGGVRRLSTTLRAAGLPSPRRRVRSYHDEHGQWKRAPIRERIEAAILRRDSLAAGIFGIEPLRAAVAAFFDRGIGPVQYVGALYTFEVYHRDLAAHLRAAARTAEASVRRPEVQTR